MLSETSRATECVHVGMLFLFLTLGCLEILGILAGLGDKRQFEDLLEFPRNGKL